MQLCVHHAPRQQPVAFNLVRDKLRNLAVSARRALFAQPHKPGQRIHRHALDARFGQKDDGLRRARKVHRAVLFLQIQQAGALAVARAHLVLRVAGQVRGVLVGQDALGLLLFHAVLSGQLAHLANAPALIEDDVGLLLNIRLLLVGQINVDVVDKLALRRLL